MMHVMHVTLTKRGSRKGREPFCVMDSITVTVALALGKVRYGKMVPYSRINISLN